MNSAKLLELLSMLAEHGYMSTHVVIPVSGKNSVSGNPEPTGSVHLTLAAERTNSTKPLELLLALAGYGYTATMVQVVSHDKTDTNGQPNSTVEIRLTMVLDPL
jgi:hypothetical protein